MPPIVSKNSFDKATGQGVAGRLFEGLNDHKVHMNTIDSIKMSSNTFLCDF